MPKMYDNAPGPVVELVDEVRRKYHSDRLNHSGDDEKTHCVISVVMVHAATDKDGEATGTALTLHGRSCAAIVKRTTLLERTLGVGDVILQLDGDRWEKWSDERQAALIDHELAHIIIGRGDDGKVKLDDRGRPKISMRQHDWEFGGFTEIVRRHGSAAFEATAIQQVATHLAKVCQLTFDWESATDEVGELTCA